MPLDPHFTSSIHGMIAAAQMALLALSMAMLQTAGATPPNAVGFAKLLLALVILGTYPNFMNCGSSSRRISRRRRRDISGASAAVSMAVLVAVTFMQLGSSRNLVPVFAVAGFFWLCIMIRLGGLNAFTRHDIPVNAGGEIRSQSR